MPPPPDPFDDREPPAPRRGGAGNTAVLGENLGPLPVWGWAVVAVAAVFLWRRIAGAGAPGAQQGQPPGGATTYPSGPSLGGVFLLPGGDSGASSALAGPAGPRWPQTHPMPVLPGTTCPAGTFLKTTQSMYTCTTPAESVQIDEYLYWLGHSTASPVAGASNWRGPNPPGGAVTTPVPATP